MNGITILLSILLVVLSVEAKRKKSADVFEHSADGSFFTLPITVGSQRTKLQVGVDGFYGSSVVFCPNVNPPAGGCSHRASRSWKQAMASREFNVSLGTAAGASGTDWLQVGTLPPMPAAMFGNPESVGGSAVAKMPQSAGFLAMWGPQDTGPMKTTMQFVAEAARKPKITFHAPSRLNGRHTITIGKEDRNNCGADWLHLPAVPALDKDEQPWTVEFDGFRWGAYNKPQKTAVCFNVAADYFVAPKRHANYIYKKLKAKHSRRYHGGLVDCAHRRTAPTLVFSVGGRRLSVRPSQYIKKFDSRTCLLNIYPDTLDWWTLPYQFHQDRCVKYHYGKRTVSIVDQM